MGVIWSWMRSYDIFFPYRYDCGMLDQFIYYSSDTHIMNSCLLDDPRLGLLAYTPVDLYTIRAGTPTSRSRPCSSVIHPSHTYEAVSFQMATSGITKLEL